MQQLLLSWAVPDAMNWIQALQVSSFHMLQSTGQRQQCTPGSVCMYRDSSSRQAAQRTAEGTHTLSEHSMVWPLFQARRLCAGKAAAARQSRRRGRASTPRLSPLQLPTATAQKTLAMLQAPAVKAMVCVVLSAQTLRDLLMWARFFTS